MKAKFQNQFVKKMRMKNETMMKTSSIQETVHDADIIVTTTPSRKPIVKAGWIKPGAHVNAIGADAEGKQELDPLLS